MLTLQNIAYTHPDKDQLFEELNFTINAGRKLSLVGNNGTGKSTLLRIMAGELQPSSGFVLADNPPCYVPQHFGQFNHLTIGEALRIDGKLQALDDILAGDMSEKTLAILDDDWGIAERSRAALHFWKLDKGDPSTRLDSLSGGEKTKVFLAGILIHEPHIVLLDEPSNHLDAEGRKLLYDYIRTGREAMVVVSHDRTLLNIPDEVCELSKKGLAFYGGNYDFYAAQKAEETATLYGGLKSKEKELRKARETERQALERVQKLDARGKKKQEKAGVPTIAMNTLRNNAEKSTARMKDVHAEKTGAIAEELNRLRKAVPDKDKMKIGFDDSTLHRGKILFTAKALTVGYDGAALGKMPMSFQLCSGQRISIQGTNGSGKTTLIRTILGTIPPISGTITRADFKAIYIDQEYSLVRPELTVFEQAQTFNTDNLPVHEVGRRLTHFLFTKESWGKSCSALSGGEKMRLVLCCLTLDTTAPDMIILDEPTNNLDIQNTEILTTAINEYSGTLIVVSHDAVFLEEIGAKEKIMME